MGRVYKPLLLGFVSISVAVMATTSMAEPKRPVALLELLENAPETDFQSFDYVYKGDKIDLRPEGMAILSYFDTCNVETIQGGQVKLSKDKAKVSKGGTSTIEKRDCRTEVVELTDEAKEAGASVKRVSPFDLEIWHEWALNTNRPMFKWPYEKRAKGDVTLKIHYVDADPTELIWQTVATGDFVQYPDDAPELMMGRPYQVTVEYPKKYSYSAVFSFDPNLELPDGPANRLVPLE